MKVTSRASDHETTAPRPILKATTALRILRKQIPITRTTFYRELQDGAIPASKLRKRYLITLETIQAYIRQAGEQTE